MANLSKTEFEKYFVYPGTYHAWRKRDPERCAYCMRRVNWRGEQCQHKPTVMIMGYGFCAQHARKIRQSYREEDTNG